ncbi:YtpR family tRNA-binding protein [Jeotgalibacillus haloalkalitolerans]|uniref:DUF4479 domain-containing protein n=1 Tax=Jeotgalibacillus haloalkalitolerans TaxID=3104292 RepID=A0ABU5KMW8_9BACL|nr:DUF4479 domain-containing protein [Jeotgalibacillus sp. HH7-29]MDZ5712510.1 DUF4479 domain-containing protein [Jeotgalibacillus sp. HH7-29]
MNVFYNETGVGEVLIIKLKDTPRHVKTFEQKGNVVQIKNSENSEVTGYNIFGQPEQEFRSEGPVEMDETKLQKVNQMIQESGFDHQIEADFSPKFVIGFVEEMEKHPNADKLNICQVNVGEERLQIVCGAPNVDAGQKVVVAKVGAVMPSGMVIKDAELRGVPSSGMICSAKELGLPNAPEKKGILVLEDGHAGEAFSL